MKPENDMKTIARSASITHLQGLSSRALMALSKAGLRTVGELVDLAEDDLMALPNIGVKLVGEITKELNKFHIVNVIYTQPDKNVIYTQPDKHAIAALKETDSKLARTRGWLGRVERVVDNSASRIEKLEARSVRGNTRDNNFFNRLCALESAVNKLTGDATLRETHELVAPPIGKGEIKRLRDCILTERINHRKTKDELLLLKETLRNLTRD